MAQGWNAQAPDSRTFGDQIARLASDLNRPDLQTEIEAYLQDAIRYYARKPFFFNETDNSIVPQWQAGLHYTAGATVYGQADDGNTYAFVNLTAGTSGTNQPTFTSTLFVPPPGTLSPPAYDNTAPGTTQDNECLWATAGLWRGQGVTWTQLSTVPYLNQYVPPLDYVAPQRIEVTWGGNFRMVMTRKSYGDMRNLDVIRPTPPSTYPVYWTWFQGQLYLWPYPVGLYPITLSYRTAAPVPLGVDESNFWTTHAEALIRNYAGHRISMVVLNDPVAAANFLKASQEEMTGLISEGIARDSGGEGSGIPPDDF